MWGERPQRVGTGRRDQHERAKVKIRREVGERVGPAIGRPDDRLVIGQVGVVLDGQQGEAEAVGETRCL